MAGVIHPETTGSPQQVVCEVKQSVEHDNGKRYVKGHSQRFGHERDGA
ncbi:hypothetical protein [Corynebacterium poyangense]|nr:hypothetical protein [Corynebacterium poyangense]